MPYATPLHTLVALLRPRQLATEGFGFMLLHRYPSHSAYGSALRYGLLYACLSAAITTLGFNVALLGVRADVQLTLDSLFLAVPCALYLLLVLPFR